LRSLTRLRNATHAKQIGKRDHHPRPSFAATILETGSDAFGPVHSPINALRAFG